MEVESRQDQYGLNEIATEKKHTWLYELWGNIKNPLVILLIILGIISLPLATRRAAVIIAFMVILGVVLRYFQETQRNEWPLKNSREWSAPLPPSSVMAPGLNCLCKRLFPATSFISQR